ncbi:MAG: hypothetical protein HXM45_01425 [Lautropia mirabilis]|nr:hypothetical protein [Lautropia mirabilis]
MSAAAVLAEPLFVVPLAPLALADPVEALVFVPVSATVSVVPALPVVVVPASVVLAVPVAAVESVVVPAMLEMGARGLEETVRRLESLPSLPLPQAASNRESAAAVSGAPSRYVCIMNLLSSNTATAIGTYCVPATPSSRTGYGEHRLQIENDASAWVKAHQIVSDWK